MNLYKIPDGIKTLINMMEKEMAPTFMVITFLISVGSFYGFAIINFTCIIVVFLCMFAGYMKVNNDVIKCSRILLVMLTLMLFVSLLADNHVFEESTLPQKIESHMTQ
jgi:ABC-type multidrug transport system permease subunit